MIVNVIGRNITVHDGMAAYHAKLHNEPVDEDLIISYLAVKYRTAWEERLRNASDEELAAAVQDGLKFDELNCHAESYDEYE